MLGLDTRVAREDGSWLERSPYMWSLCRSADVIFFFFSMTGDMNFWIEPLIGRGRGHTYWNQVECGRMSFERRMTCVGCGRVIRDRGLYHRTMLVFLGVYIYIYIDI